MSIFDSDIIDELKSLPKGCHHDDEQDAVSQTFLMEVDKNDHIVNEILRKIEGIKESVLKSYDGRLADLKILKMAKRDFAEGIIPYQKMLTEYLATRPTTSFNIEFSDIDKIIKM